MFDSFSRLRFLAGYVAAFVDNEFWNIRYQYNDHEGFPRNSLPI
jgi:hypothetical protein